MGSGIPERARKRPHGCGSPSETGGNKMATNDTTALSGAALPADAAGSEKEISIRELLLYLLSKWKKILSLAVLGASLAAILVFLILTPTYKATCKLYIISSTNSVVDLSALQLGNSMTADYQQMFKNHIVHDQVKEALGLDYEYEKLEKMIKVSNPAGTHILYISAYSHDPEEAANLANTYATVARQFIKERLDSRMPSVFEDAMIPEKKDSPHTWLSIALGAVLGGILGCVIYLLRFVNNDYVTTAAQVEKRLGLSVLGVMPADDVAERSPKQQKAGHKRQ